MDLFIRPMVKCHNVLYILIVCPQTIYQRNCLRCITFIYSELESLYINVNMHFVSVFGSMTKLLYYYYYCINPGMVLWLVDCTIVVSVISSFLHLFWHTNYKICYFQYIILWIMFDYGIFKKLYAISILKYIIDVHDNNLNCIHLFDS